MMSYDDRIIMQISETIKQIKVARVVYSIESLDYDDYNDYDQDEYFDKIQKILLPLNKHVKEAFALCDRIKDKVLQGRVYMFLEDVFQVDERNWDQAIQSCVEYSGGWDDVISDPNMFDKCLEECMEVSFDAYLETHDYDSCFETSTH